jgi:MarR family transcriptional regulator, organic hydroperoxide resistance regulator
MSGSRQTRKRGAAAGESNTRQDLAAMIVPLGRVLMRAELPVLEAHDLTMWGYVVLQALTSEPTRSQASLAEAIGADKTRLISTLDALQHDGLIARGPDPNDRRVHLLAITAKGSQIRHAAQTAIQKQEERLLATLPAGDRSGFMRILTNLSHQSPTQILQELGVVGG